MQLSSNIRFHVDRKNFNFIRFYFQLHHLESGRLLDENETMFMADGSPSTFRVSFKDPLEIQQGEFYVASAKLKVRFDSIRFENEQC